MVGRCEQEMTTNLVSMNLSSFVDIFLMKYIVSVCEDINAKGGEIGCPQSEDLERVPTRSEIEAELKSRREDAVRRAGKSHLTDGSRKGGKIDLSSPSSRVSNAGVVRDLHKRMLGLEENMKFIMAALKIGGVDSRDTAKEGIGAVGEASNVENPSTQIASADIEKECLQPELQENEVIVFSTDSGEAGIEGAGEGRTYATYRMFGSYTNNDMIVNMQGLNWL